MEVLYAPYRITEDTDNTGTVLVRYSTTIPWTIFLFLFTVLVSRWYRRLNESSAKGVVPDTVPDQPWGLVLHSAAITSHMVLSFTEPRRAS